MMEGDKSMFIDIKLKGVQSHVRARERELDNDLGISY